MLKAQIVTDGRIRMTDAETIERLEEMQNYFSFMTSGNRSETIDSSIEAVKFKSTIKDIIDNTQNRIEGINHILGAGTRAAFDYIAESYADMYADIKREVEKCEDAG